MTNPNHVFIIIFTIKTAPLFYFTYSIFFGSSLSLSLSSHAGMDSHTRRKRQRGMGEAPTGELNPFGAWPTTPPPHDVIPSSPERPPLWLHREISNVNDSGGGGSGGGGGGGGGGISFPSSAKIVNDDSDG